MTRGYYGVGVYHPKREVNVGTIWRHATLYGASFVFTVGSRYTSQASDTTKTPRHTPHFHFADLDDLREHLPWSTPLVGVELDDRAIPLREFTHPERAVYLLGAEDHGLPDDVLAACHHVTRIVTPAAWSMNVAAAATLVMDDRFAKAGEIA